MLTYIMLLSFHKNTGEVGTNPFYVAITPLTESPGSAPGKETPMREGKRG